MAKITPEELAALKYAGVMGHEYAILRKDLSLGAECNTEKRAIETAKEVDGTVYQQVRRRIWKKIEF